MRVDPQYVSQVLNENFEDAKTLFLTPLMAIHYAHLVMLAERGIVPAADAHPDVKGDHVAGGVLLDDEAESIGQDLAGGATGRGLGRQLGGSRAGAQEEEDAHHRHHGVGSYHLGTGHGGEA